MRTPPFVVVVSEKPFCGRVLAPYLTARWPDHRILLVYTYSLGLYEFRYPRDMRFADTPYILEPQWKLRGNVGHAVWEIRGKEVVPCDSPLTTSLLDAETICYACDPDARGASAWHVLLSQVLGKEGAAVPRPLIELPSYDPATLLREIHGDLATTQSATFTARLNAGVAKRFFDFNFNVNAMILLGEALRQTGDATAQASRSIGMSKYGLQLLYHLRQSRGTEVSEDDVMQSMQAWRGTGRYAVDNASDVGLGSASSRDLILENLLSLHLTELVGSGAQSLYRITSQGLRFLDLLHKDCEDPDLPFRLHQWEQSWPASQAPMERYLRTFFGKQRERARRQRH